MGDKINEKFLRQVRFSADSPIAWILQAQGFYYTAEATLKGNNLIKKGPFDTAKKTYLFRFCYQKACYLLAHSIELSLKAIYCLNVEGEKHAEDFGHNILRLFDDLLDKKILKKYDVDRSILELAYILLEWQGRYHKPRENRLDINIEKIYTRSPDNPDVFEKKVGIDRISFEKLRIIAQILIQKVNIPLSLMDYLFFDPF